MTESAQAALKKELDAKMQDLAWSFQDHDGSGEFKMLFHETLQGMIDAGVRQYCFDVNSKFEEHMFQIEQRFSAELEAVTARHELEQVEQVLHGIIAQVQLRAELCSAHKAEISSLVDEVVKCESCVDAVVELMPCKNFLQVGAKLGESKARIYSLERQLKEEQRSHADSLEVIRGQLTAANLRLKKLAIGDRSLASAEKGLKAMKAGGRGRQVLVDKLRNAEMPSAADRAKAAGITPQQFNQSLALSHGDHPLWVGCWKHLSYKASPGGIA